MFAIIVSDLFSLLLSLFRIWLYECSNDMYLCLAVCVHACVFVCVYVCAHVCVCLHACV